LESYKGIPNSQKQFILQHVLKCSTTKKMEETNRRTSTLDYFLTVTCEKKRVCIVFFPGALGLGEYLLNTSGAGIAFSDMKAEKSHQNFQKNRVT